MSNAISAGHAVTLSVAKEILHAGGNAFDAAIAAHFAMFVTEPAMASAGGNGFAITKAANDKFRYFDFFCQTPRFKTDKKIDFFPIEVNFGSETEEFYIGLGSAAVPGSISAMYQLHKMYGTIPIEILMEPVMHLAKEGVVIDTFQAYDFSLLKPILKQSIKGRELYFDNDTILTEGQVLRMPEVNDFFEFLKREGDRGFYFGEIANAISKDSNEKGGNLRREDFENYCVNISTAFCFPYKNKKIYTSNFPSNGGAALALMLSKTKDDTTLSLAESIRQTQEILSDKKLLERELENSYPQNNYNVQYGDRSEGGTSHFNILDKKGNAISLTSSIGEGSGYFIPGTSMQLNNMLGEIFLLPNGAHSWSPNSRMHSMMTPTMMASDKGILEWIGGSGGASRIPYAIGQVIFHLLNGYNIAKAIEEPRVHYQNNKYQLELGSNLKTPEHSSIFWDSKSLYFGGVHAIHLLKNRIQAVGDARRYGVSEVF